MGRLAIPQLHASANARFCSHIVTEELNLGSLGSVCNRFGIRIVDEKITVGLGRGRVDLVPLPLSRVGGRRREGIEMAEPVRIIGTANDRPPRPLPTGGVVTGENPCGSQDAGAVRTEIDTVGGTGTVLICGIIRQIDIVARITVKRPCRRGAATIIIAVLNGAHTGGERGLIGGIAFHLSGNAVTPRAHRHTRQHNAQNHRIQLRHAMTPRISIINPTLPPR